MNIFDQYGIKEVADVTLYSIHKKKDGSGDVYYVPALYIDTLKMSSVEKTAENVWAQGGLGNARLICWDYGKQINVTLEDALCTPASLGMCWGGILGADWKDSEIKQDFGISFNRNPVEKISRMEKAFYPKNDKTKSSISYLLPQSSTDLANTIDSGIILNSEVVDGARVEGFGYVRNRVYKWKMYIESDVKSIAIVPDRFFDVNGESYKISQAKAIGVNTPSQDTPEFKIEVIYSINPEEDGNGIAVTKNSIIIEENVKDTSTTYVEGTPLKIDKAKFLKIRVDNNDNYHAYLGSAANQFESIENLSVDTSLFKGIDMWNRFQGINEMIYFILTKYEEDIFEINLATLDGGETIGTNFSKEVAELGTETSEEVYNKTGKLWAYVNPKTMTPYPDDYWFSQGEPYYIKSLTFAPKGKKLKSKRIEITAGQFPGMYMLVGETYIRSRDTGEDERMQIKFPLCKVLSNQNLTLEAEGDPTIFNLDIEVARPTNGIMMEITSYEIAEKMIPNEEGFLEIKDGSTEILSE